MSNSNTKQNIKKKIFKQLHWDFLMKIKIIYFKKMMQELKVIHKKLHKPKKKHIHVHKSRVNIQDMVSYERFLTNRIIINNQYNVLIQVFVVHLEQLWLS